MKELTKCFSGLDWEKEFLHLLKSMDERIEDPKAAVSQKEKDIKYQTMYAIAAFFGPDNGSFLKVTWDDVEGKKILDRFSLDVGLKREVFFGDFLVQIVDKNYTRLNPVNRRHLVLSKTDNPMESINIRQFNATFERDLKKAGIAREKASTITLRKTLGWHVLKDIYDDDTDGLLMACKLLGHKSIDQTMDLLEIPESERSKYTQGVYKRI